MIFQNNFLNLINLSINLLFLESINQLSSEYVPNAIFYVGFKFSIIAK